MSTSAPIATSPNARQANWSLVAAIGGVLVAWAIIQLAFFGGFEGSDDFHHLRFAWFWDHVPVDHWETRLLFNAILRLSLLTFGFSQVSASVPNLLGQILVIVSGMYLAWRWWRSIGMMLMVGMLLSSLPINLGWAPNAKPLATGLASVGLVVLLVGRGVGSAIAAGMLFSLAMWCHPVMLFFASIAIVVAAVMRMRPWQQCVLALGVTATAYAAGEFGTFYLWTGDALYGFRTISSVHLKLMPFDTDYLARTGGSLCSWRFIWTPIQDLLGSRGLGVTGLAAVSGVILCRRSLDRRVWAMVWIALLTWVWMSYGTQTPTTYLPFPMTVNYWGTMSIPLAMIVTVAVMRSQRLSVRFGASAGLVAVNLLMLALAGSWGQNVKVSGELLDYALAHPQNTFVSDNITLTEMYVLNRFRPIANVRRLPGTVNPKFWNTEPLLSTPTENGPILAMFNPMNDRETNDSFKLLSSRLGNIVYQGSVCYRAAAYLLPVNYRQNHAWTIRHPAAQVHIYRY